MAHEQVAMGRKLRVSCQAMRTMFKGYGFELGS